MPHLVEDFQVCTYILDNKRRTCILRPEISPTLGRRRPLSTEAAPDVGLRNVRECILRARAQLVVIFASKCSHRPKSRSKFTAMRS